MTSNTICWIITEGIAGTENQCLGVAQALGVTPIVKRISLSQPWRMLCPFIGFEKDFTFTPPLTPPWPDLLITSGRKSIACARYIKRRSGNKTFAVHIQDPRTHNHPFDLIAVPAHDSLRGENVIVTAGTPNLITPEKIKTAQDSFAQLRELPSPRIAVLIGGTSKAYTMTSSVMANIVTNLQSLRQTYQAGLMITCSRRTPAALRDLLMRSLTSPQTYIWDGNSENPYFAMLGYADYILVTADSTSMISESCTTGKPVYLLDMVGGSRRISTFHDHLIKRGCLKNFSGTLETFSYEPLNDAMTVAQEIKKRANIFTPE